MISPADGEDAEFVSWCEEVLKPALEGIPGHVVTRTYKVVSHKLELTNKLHEKERVWGQPPSYLNLHEFRDLRNLHLIPVKRWSEDIDEGRRGCECIRPFLNYQWADLSDFRLFNAV